MDSPHTPSRVHALDRVLSSIEPGDTDLAPTVHKAIALARILQTRGVALQSPQERRQQREFERMMTNPADKITLTQLTDQAFRSKTARRAAEQLTHILDVQGIPRFFTLVERALLRGFQSFGNYLPGVSVPMVKDKMREETANVILPAESEVLGRHLASRRLSGVRMNVNFLGEALLGEEDAHRRLQHYLAALQLEEIEVISVKISTIYSQISAIARERSIAELCDRMELLYRAAVRARYTRADGTVVPKFIYLDMEEYRDLSITLEVFMATLERPGLEAAEAGIALQAYLPDSYAAQLAVNKWARARVAAGGAPVTIRIVKGANMEMERVEASMAGWPQAPFCAKAETDANFKRMLQEALTPENAAAVRIGVASHNLFDVAYALVLAHERGVVQHVQFEMLEGMANHQRRAIHELTDNLLLYAPATRKDAFVNAIGYLIRRLDENTGPENFLRHAFKLTVDSSDWKQLENGFIRSFELISTLPTGPRRTQDRNQPVEPRGTAVTVDSFVNEPDTDFSLPRNFEWAHSIVANWRDKIDSAAVEIPVVIAGDEMYSDRSIRPCLDPSRPQVVCGRYRQATASDIDRAITCARADPSGWRDRAAQDRADVLTRVAHELRTSRADLMGAALADGGKLLQESDPEVSEAIDFVEYYAATARALCDLKQATARPKGVIVVVPPWNFPIAIPCGGIAAGLAAGNTVILKPASNTVLVAYQLCQCFWRAGVPKEALQFAPCSGAHEGARLVASDDVDVVILTGGTDTALRMLDARPAMHLLAETGGKNATIVTALADREQAVKHVLHSAFGHSGQKCSATSLLILEAEVFDDPAFKETLCDGVKSLRVGSAWQFDTRIGPMIAPPAGDLEKAFKELEHGESWAVMPHVVDGNPCLWAPAVKWGVGRRSYTHMTEFFGPVLAVMRADNLADAIEAVNETGYGLTSGLESLDAREHDIWRQSIRAGNLYINRPTTGAIVQRQPFGGMGKSAFGPGIKAGGPNYVAQLMSFSDQPGVAVDSGVSLSRVELESLRGQLGEVGADARRLEQALCSYDAAYLSEFGVEHDDVRLLGQDNIRTYLPVQALRIRVHPEDSSFEILARVFAAKTVGCGIVVSIPNDFTCAALTLLDRITEPWGAGIEFVEESDDELSDVVREQQTQRVRYADSSRVPIAVRQAIGDTGVYIADAPVLIEGRIELLWYVMEQSISASYHRYGNLGARATEVRRPVL